MQEVLVSHLGGLSLPRKSVVRLTDRPDKTFASYRGHKTTTLLPFFSMVWSTKGNDFPRSKSVPSRIELF